MLHFSFRAFREIVFVPFVLLLISPAAASNPLPVQAKKPPIEGFHFSHKDWEVACDNTRTCRAAGYQAEMDDRSVSVLLTRTAGPGTPVTGQITFGDFQFDALAGELLRQYGESAMVELRINNKSYGRFKMESRTLEAVLPPNHVKALLKALLRDSVIEWILDEQHRWVLSDDGAAAVLIKMDEFQGRLHTPGALARKGNRKENTVYPPRHAPVIHKVALPPTRADDLRLVQDKPAELIDALRATVDYDTCSILMDRATKDIELTIIRLSVDRLLVASPCWLGAYNFGSGVWVINDIPPYNPEMVFDGASDVLPDGDIVASHKGRGFGDCWSSSRHTWNGTEFVPSSQSSTGMCRSFVGGAWNFPTRVTDVRPAPGNY
ncbi:MAG: DUF1176 domain-containing protein [Deltaproteobacteria bacterium]|nr:DUF1176 domain-containing protein [Deltaproteobacteria bacterium]MBN2671610.1 DUF1176 domain-containing protein [Deltaproteobacteria bacterium]